MGTSSYLIAVGGNSPESRRIIDRLCFGFYDADGISLVGASSVHSSPPLGPGGRTFANAAIHIQTSLTPPALLACLKAIERAYGRRPARRWGARPLDLDIISWSGGRWSNRSLTIPHAAFRIRRFVLAPLVEIAPDWRDPVTGRTVRQLLARLDRRRRAP